LTGRGRGGGARDESALQALRDRVQSFFEGARRHRGGDLLCERGCDACCYVDLSVGSAEAANLQVALSALRTADLDRLVDRALDPSTGTNQEGRAPCVMLDESGGCAVYEARPMICRTQGLALRYPAGLIPPEALSAKATDGSDLTWCPLNYQNAPPAPANILDAERVDRPLGHINTAAADKGTSADTRYSLRHLVLLQKGL